VLSGHLGLGNNKQKCGTGRELSPTLLLVPCSAYFSTPKMEAMRSSETWGFFRTSRPYNLEDRALRSHRCETSNPTATLVTNTTARDTDVHT
jgi:hypothetical protein